jgi:hypothetical protein
MKIRLLLMLAIALTMFAVNAKAINPWTEECDSNSQQSDITVTVCGKPVTVTVCWKCPDLTTGSTLHIKIIGALVFPEGLPSSCADFWELLAKEVTAWGNVILICPTWANDIPPCFTPPPIPTPPKKKVDVRFPLCYKYDIPVGGTAKIIPCDPIKCHCLRTYEYCYNSGQILQTTITTGVVPGADFTEEDCNPSPCATPFEFISIPFPWGTSGCGSICY